MTDKDKTDLDNDAETELYSPSTTVVDGDETEVYTGTSDTVGGASSTTIEQLRPGFMLKERFELQDMLGQGGMGAVFRARDLRKVEADHHDPSVAIKVITGDFARDSRAFVALQRETDKSQTLAHPNIITVYDFDRDGSIFFMTMESLSGEVLSQYIAREDKARQEILSYILDLSSAISYAHKRNIVHSDLKPANIFITENGTLKVLDFGIARAYSAIESDKSVQDPNEIVGFTPAYASYEMFEYQPTHPADDVYALGLIAYEMLTGCHPYDRKTAKKADEENLKPKRIGGLASYQWKAIRKALALRRDDRWQTAEEFRKAFSGSGRRVKQLSASLLVAVLAFGAYLAFFQPEAGPEIPFEELPQETQSQVLSQIKEAEQALSFGDINGALFYLDRAYQLHPRNHQVMERLDSIVNRIVGEMESNPDSQRTEYYQEQINELLKYSALRQNSTLLEKQKEMASQ